MVHCVRSPRLATSLRALLTPVGTGLLVGDVSRRVADAVVIRVEEEVWSKSGRATIISQSDGPQGFLVREFGHQRMVELDGLQLARVRVPKKDTTSSQQICSETDGIL